MSSTPPKTDQTEITRGLAAQLPRNLAANIAYFLVNIVIGVSSLGLQFFQCIGFNLWV